MASWLNSTLLSAGIKSGIVRTLDSLGTNQLTQTAILIGLVAVCLLGILSGRKDLDRVPGPWIASWTDVYRFLVVYRRHVHLETVALHQKYGRYVRLGPNFVSISDPAAVPAIYGVAKGFSKSSFYEAVDLESNGKLMQSAFATRDLEWHRSLRKPVANAYAMPTLISYEPLVASTTKYFLDIIRSRFCKPGQVCDLLKWLQYYAFDVTGEITFSERLGFLEQGLDLGGICKAIEEHFSYGAPVGQMPWLDRVWRRNPLLRKKQKSTAMVDYTMKLVQKRLEEKEGKYYDDFLSRFFKCQEGEADNTAKITFVIHWATTNVGSGSDTTGITLAALFHYLLTDTRSMRTLQEEIDSTKFVNTTDVLWEEARHMPYLQACIKEALRLHPAIGLHLERVVPEGGLSIAGYWFRPGTIVGVNGWAVHRDTEVYGNDAEAWRPERWLDSSPEQLKRMDRGFFSFGGGSRNCIGKNISLLELSKLAPQLLRTFEMELASKDEKWETEAFWFAKPKSLNVRFKERSPVKDG